MLGIDYGSKRIGLAISDELGVIAQPLSIIERKNKQSDLEAIRKIIDSYQIEKIIIGYPVRLDGTEGIQCEKVDRFIALLNEELKLPIVKWNESLSSWEAEEVISEAGIKGKDRKKFIDKIAAAIILQSYLDQAKNVKISNQ